MSNFANRFIAQGMQQGVQQGVHLGGAAMLLRMLEAKFGSVASEIKQRIEAADMDELHALSSKLFAANVPEDLWH